MLNYTTSNRGDIRQKVKARPVTFLDRTLAPVYYKTFIGNSLPENTQGSECVQNIKKCRSCDGSKLSRAKGMCECRKINGRKKIEVSK